MYYITFFTHLPLKNLVVNIIPRIVQSANIPYHTPIGPIPNIRISAILSATRQPHIVIIEVIIENHTSPAALIPYAGTKDNTQTSGFTIVIAPTISIHIRALSVSIPPSLVIGPANA